MKNIMKGLTLLLAFVSFRAYASDIVIAVIDTGVDIHHKDLKSNIWTNPGESGLDQYGRSKATNNIDDDKNGYIDDVHGWNFVSDNNQVIDVDGHGTHVAGIIQKRYKSKNKSYKKVKIMPLKYYSSELSSKDNVLNTIKALQYATLMKVHIINYSAGGQLPQVQELKAIEIAAQAGIIMVTAAGNEHENTDLNHYYPASYGLDNMISVAALQKNGHLSQFSNYGSKTIDLAAPGKMIYSTLPENRYGFLSGTSQATAFVSGELAVIMAKNKALNYREHIKNLFQKAVYNPHLKGRTKFQVALLAEVN